MISFSYSSEHEGWQLVSSAVQTSIDKLALNHVRFSSFGSDSN